MNLTLHALGAAVCRAALGLSALISAPAFADGKSAISIEKPWARATVAGAAVGGGYLTVRNSGAADRLIGASSPAAARTELHEMAMEKDVMRMREVKGVDVPAKGTLELKPGGYHLMFVELVKPLRQGDKVPLTLRFEKAGEVKVELDVETVGAGAATKHGGMHHGGMKH